MLIIDRIANQVRGAAKQQLAGEELSTYTPLSYSAQVNTFILFLLLSYFIRTINS